MGTKQNKKIDSKGHEEVWIWEETPETIQALKNLHNTVKKVNDSKK